MLQENIHNSYFLTCLEEFRVSREAPWRAHWAVSGRWHSGNTVPSLVPLLEEQCWWWWQCPPCSDSALRTTCTFLACSHSIRCIICPQTGFWVSTHNSPFPEKAFDLQRCSCSLSPSKSCSLPPSFACHTLQKISIASQSNPDMNFGAEMLCASPPSQCGPAELDCSSVHKHRHTVTSKSCV